MPISKNLGKTFDTVASAYEKMRLGYVRELYEKIFEYIPLNAESSVVEVGIGSGQAALPVLESGCTFTAVECGENFSELCRKKLSIIQSIQYLQENLKNFLLTGTFMTSHPDPGKNNPALKGEMDRLYDTYYDTVHKRKQPVRRAYGEKQAQQKAMIAQKYGFGDIRYYLFHRERVLSAAEYTALMGTYSDHIIIEENVRKEFFTGIEEAINKHGGTITIYDTLDLELARKV